MIAHTPTIFACVALVATVMAFCLILAGQVNHRDGLFTTGCGLLAHALAYVCYTLYGHAPLWLTYSVANTLLAVALAFYLASIYRIRALAVPWWMVLSLPLLMALLMVVLIEHREPRMLASSSVLMLQCLLIVVVAQRRASPGGRAHVLLIIGGGISLIGLGLRVVAILFGTAPEMQYDVSNLKQTISVSIGTVTVMMFSLGLVLLSKERSEASLHHMALRDALTGMLNRRAILEQLSGELERARRAGSSLAIAMIDIDHFKQINDQYGHLAGDEVLCHCVRHLSQQLRQSDTIGRYGGEEFLLLLPDTPPAGAMTVVDALRQSLAANPALFGKRSIPLSFSAGLWCGVPGPGDSSDSLIARADAALYAAKQDGRNTLRLLQAGDAQDGFRSLAGAAL
ncbi:GGDEF domain-containing protein [Pseudomonas sp. PDM14]|uniref:GGDEF domain-containing protein n=1 Tax=Pseudomonas sp. PDM14 TaxID=2769288 RepID=UPI001783E9D4|nr:GGDEF domain-containing protein [Pseudomonas sp. PDM14]MBD9483306.1 GGDEF domain-containing protein [Pseudomonas sp. PDM14]